MSKIKKILLIILSAVFVATCCAAVACSSNKDWRKPAGGITDNGSRDPNNPTGDLPFYYPEGLEKTDEDDEDNAYVIKTQSMGGMPIDNVRVTLRKNGVTVIEGISQNGGVKFGGIEFTDYQISYADLPMGYYEAEGTVYTISADKLSVTSRFTSSVISTSMPSGWVYNMGDVMYNFRYTDYNGTTLVLSDLLKEKKAVVLNFWATWCSPCASEFPALNNAYNKYKNDIEVIALSIDSSDTNEVINTYKTKMGLDFFMANDNLNLASSLGGRASVPTTVIIDRYGIIAFRHVGSIPSDLEWEARFREYTSDDYTQDPEQITGGITGTDEPIKPYDFLTFDPIDNNAFNQAFLHSSMTEALEYASPAEDTNDGMYNWPFQVADDAANGSYIRPTNVGTYSYDGKKYATDNTWSILHTSLTIEADQTLWVDVRYNTESGNDILYVIINNSTVNGFSGSGQNNNWANGGWDTVQLYASTRSTTLDISIMYYKSTIGSPDDEFVGLKNLKITTLDIYSPEALDIRSELSDVEDDGSFTYKDVYLADDGFYHVMEGNVEDPANDSIIFVDIMYITLWQDRHIRNFSLRSNDGYSLLPSLYQISFWLFGGSVSNFGYGSAATKTILDCFYVQDGSMENLTPVNEAVKDALIAFTQHAFDNSQVFGNYYTNGYNENTWLELCCYYRTVGLGKGYHTADEHEGCKAHTNPGAGRILQYAIELKEGINHVDTSIAASVNFMNGVFYRLDTFAGTGVYRIRSLREYVEGDTVDPYILVWGSNSNAYNGNPLVEQDDSQGVERFSDNYSYNFDVLIYLRAGEYVYPQITTRMVESPGQFDVSVQYLGAEYWEFRSASTTEGMWVGDASSAVYGAISSTLSGPVDPTDGKTQNHYHLLRNGEVGSVIYIDFIHANYFDQNGNSLADMIERGAFDFADGSYTSKMQEFLRKALDKDEDDPTYGMIEANDKLVKYLATFMQQESKEEAYNSGYWKAFAYYYQYYGATEWVEMY